MTQIRLALVAIGLIIAAIGHWLALECARVAGTRAVAAAGTAAGWLAARLNTATQAIEANRLARVAARNAA